MNKEQADRLAAAFFNAIHWALQPPEAIAYRQGSIEGLSEALQEAFPEEKKVFVSKIKDGVYGVHTEKV